MERKEKKKVKFEYDTGMIDAVISWLNEAKENYTISFTNYTALIESETTIYNFIKHMKRPIVFGIANELKTYMDTSLVHGINRVNENELKYYSAKIVSRNFYLDTVYSIDINAAYPTCLLNSGLIDDKMYGKLMRLDKDERLAAIGMLASRKKIFNVIAGNVVSYEDVKSEYSKFFFHCVSVIGNLIWQCEILTGLSYIFSWVDCLYVKDLDAAKICKQELHKRNYNSEICTLKDFQYNFLTDHINIRFVKQSKGEELVKVFNIPIEKNNIHHIIKTLHHEN